MMQFSCHKGLNYNSYRLSAKSAEGLIVATLTITLEVLLMSCNTRYFETVGLVFNLGFPVTKASLLF